MARQIRKARQSRRTEVEVEDPEGFDLMTPWERVRYAHFRHRLERSKRDAGTDDKARD